MIRKIKTWISVAGISVLLCFGLSFIFEDREAMMFTSALIIFTGIIFAISIQDKPETKS